MQTLTSAHNPALKEIRKAIARGSQTEAGLCVAEGLHLLEEALRSSCDIDSIFASETAWPGIEQRLGDRILNRNILPDTLFRTIAATETTQGVIALVNVPHVPLTDLFRPPAMVLALDAVQDPGNAGAMIRAAEAFGASGVAFLKHSVNPYNPKSLRASAGSTFRMPIATGIAESDLLDAAHQHAATIYALVSGQGTPIAECRLDAPCILIVGNESRGVSPSFQQRANAVRIPTIHVESLNAAMAATVALYEARRQRTSARP